MTEEQIKLLIQSEVKKQLKAEKAKLFKLVESKLLHTGEYARCFRVMDIFDEWRDQ